MGVELTVFSYWVGGWVGGLTTHIIMMKIINDMLDGIRAENELKSLGSKMRISHSPFNYIFCAVLLCGGSPM